MAEAWTRVLKGTEYEAHSAGVAVTPLDKRAVKVMSEVGIDISNQSPKHIDSLGDMEFDYVVTLCSNARETCPYFPAKTRILHREFDDPPVLAMAVTSDDEKMAIYRRVRDEIRGFVESFPNSLEET